MYRSRSSRGEETFSISSLSDTEDDVVLVNNESTKIGSRYGSIMSKRIRKDRSYDDNHYKEKHFSEKNVRVESVVDPSVCDFQGELLHNNSTRTQQMMPIGNTLDEGGRYREDRKSYNDRRSGYGEKRKYSSDRSEKVDKKHVFDGLKHGDTRADYEGDRSEHKESRSSRLSRLEKMVEILVQTTVENASQKPDFDSLETSSLETVGKSSNLSTSAWLNKISNECLEKDYDEHTCMNFLQSKMSGLMKSWFKTIDAFEFTWPELKMFITRTFPDVVDFASTLRLLVNRYKEPNETVTQYYFAKMYLAEACKISGRNAVSCLIDGLTDLELQRKAKEYNFPSPELFYSQFLVHLPNYGISQPDQLHDQEFAERGYRYSKERDVEKEVYIRKCSVCGKTNHTTEMCFFNSNSYTCFKCGKKGHIATACHR